MHADLSQQIRQQAAACRAIILAHNYQPDEIQALADFTGDSLELSRKAAQVDAEIIVFCGVYFMAETAALLNPTRTILLPDIAAGCPMANMLDAEQLRQLKGLHPGAQVVCYVNSTAEVKAESDICCTSANAVPVVQSLDPQRPVIFVPDQHLGHFVQERTGRPLIIWPGYCPTHVRIQAREVAAARAAHPGALVLAHPECSQPVRHAADQVLSTGQMCRYAAGASTSEFIIATEVGLLYRLRKENPGKRFYPATSRALCPNMKKITLEKVLLALQRRAPVVAILDAGIQARARQALERMLTISA
ncbi:MAG: quinolinate synthase NadA [Kiritimatiellaeota bacterium]|nr:quinolinate synthase NadA [Kiritimatiellota bacterium]